MRFPNRERRPPTVAAWRRAFDKDGLAISASLSVGGDPVDGDGVEDLLQQLADEGFATNDDKGSWSIAWDALYDLQRHDDYASALGVFRLPPVTDVIPCLESRGALTDPGFTIAIGVWCDRNGRTIGVSAVTGAVLSIDAGPALMMASVWHLCRDVVGFLNRRPEERTEGFHRREWGRIRRSAVSAGARLDDFLYRTVVLTPERLRIDLRRSDPAGNKVVEVIPGFEGCPATWLDSFDRTSAVLDRYDLATPEGVIQIVLSPPVKTVLQEIKRMPGRRVAGPRAEAFVLNPFATLGEHASQVIDREQFERAQAEAELATDRFVADVERDGIGYPVQVGLLVESLVAAAMPAPAEIVQFADDAELERFLDHLERKQRAGHQLCAWQDYEFELGGDTADQIEILRRALEQRQKPRVLVSYAQIYDMSAYSERIEDIGYEKPYYAAYIARQNDDEGWFPENLIPVIGWTPEGESETVALPMTKDVIDTLNKKIDEARASGAETIGILGAPQPMPISEAQDIVSAFEATFAVADRGDLDPENKKSSSDNTRHKNLVVKANIVNVDYEEIRRDKLLSSPSNPALPRSLRLDVSLKTHQLEGVGWLQHLFRQSPEHCRGAILADDMGLGKTLQLLTLIAWAFEEDPALPPCLVVAPVSLLENWREEIEKFFDPGSLSSLTAYGDALSDLRLPPAAIDKQLRQDGLTKFLKPGWREAARVVLTTYETMRDLEFSFAAEKWSIMVCDEAQKIKTPSAMMTRAAKKQNVRFKIACTGTPVENTLADLWCLFDLVQPGMLGALNEFGQRYRKPIEANTEEEKARVQELREKIKPQLLRRTKAEVARDLPEKKLVEDGCKLPLSTDQRNLYAHAVDQFRRRNEEGVASPFKNALGLLQYLRLICTDPRRYGLDAVISEPIDTYRRRAPKMDWLLATLQRIKAAGEKAIIFCEFRGIQRLLKHYIRETLGVSADIVNGETSVAPSCGDSRQKRIKAFQAGPGFAVIILSPVAVGFGVNIQAANHVIHYTRTWNPAKEDQATDRAYRIGQTKPVYVYCPIAYAEDFTTFDDKLDCLLALKRSLADDMLNGAADISPCEFRISEVVPGGASSLDDTQIDADQLARINPNFFEAMIAALWQKRGYRICQLTPSVGDDGVDVVAFTGETGELIQCKTASTENAGLSWDAVKDVVTGAASYRQRFPGIAFQNSCATNQRFNETARRQADLNGVTLYDREALLTLLAEHPLTLGDVERVLYTDWHQSA
jgi:Superfamily II DNA/RNA helicases, SNF2 family